MWIDRWLPPVSVTPVPHMTGTADVSKPQAPMFENSLTLIVYLPSLGVRPNAVSVDELHQESGINGSTNSFGKPHRCHCDAREVLLLLHRARAPSIFSSSCQGTLWTSRSSHSSAPSVPGSITTLSIRGCVNFVLAFLSLEPVWTSLLVTEVSNRRP